MLTCKDASQVMSQSLDRNLTLREKVSLRFHLIICKPCLRVRQQLTFLRMASKRLATEPVDIPSSQPGLSPEAQGRILKELQRKQDGLSAPD